MVAIATTDVSIMQIVKLTAPIIRPIIAPRLKCDELDEPEPGGRGSEAPGLAAEVAVGFEGEDREVAEG